MQLRERFLAHAPEPVHGPAIAKPGAAPTPAQFAAGEDMTDVIAGTPEQVAEQVRRSPGARRQPSAAALSRRVARIHTLDPGAVDAPVLRAGHAGVHRSRAPTRPASSQEDTDDDASRRACRLRPLRDVSLFVRRFGEPGATPLLILHGANYYDSRDWVKIAAELAATVRSSTYDFRGYGLSSWSAGQDYSLDAHLLDIDQFARSPRLESTPSLSAIRAAGHSRCASPTSIAERVAGLALVDFSPGQTPGRSRFEPLRIGPWGAVYESLERRTLQPAAILANSRRTPAVLGWSRSLAGATAVGSTSGEIRRSRTIDQTIVLTGDQRCSRWTSGTP